MKTQFINDEIIPAVFQIPFILCSFLERIYLGTAIRKLTLIIKLCQSHCKTIGNRRISRGILTTFTVILTFRNNTGYWISSRILQNSSAFCSKWKQITAVITTSVNIDKETVNSSFVINLITTGPTQYSAGQWKAVHLRFGSVHAIFNINRIYFCRTWSIQFSDNSSNVIGNPSSTVRYHITSAVIYVKSLISVLCDTINRKIHNSMILAGYHINDLVRRQIIAIWDNSSRCSVITSFLISGHKCAIIKAMVYCSAVSFPLRNYTSNVISVIIHHIAKIDTSFNLPGICRWIIL